MFRRSFFMLLLALTMRGTAQGPEGSFYSKAAYPIWDKIAGSLTPIVIPSPDKKSSVTAHYNENGGADGNQPITLTVAGALGSLQLGLEGGVGAEFLWAPDSKAFFVTWSDGGTTGDYHLFVVDTFDGKLQSRELSELISSEYGHPNLCDLGSRPPNVAGIGWVAHSHRVWVAAQEFPDSVCDSMGTFKAYEVDPGSMKILRVLGQIEAKRALASMIGRVLKAAPDECIRNPKSCYSPANHPKLQPK